MHRFEDFRPKLKPCVIHSEGPKVVVEELATHRHYMLPVDALPVVNLLDGTHSVREIVTKLHEEHVAFRFASLFETIQQLQDARFLEEPEGQATRTDVVSGKRLTLFDRGHALLNRLRWSRVLIPKVELPFRARFAFYFLSVLVMLCSVLSVWTDDYFRIPNDFASYRGSYAAGIGVLILASAFLMSARSVLLMALQLLATGRCYGISLRALRFSINFGVTDSAVYLSKGRRLPFFFHLASLGAFTAITGILEIWLGKADWFADLKTAAIFLTLLEMNPYLPSDTNKLFRLFQPDELLSHVIPYLKNRSLLSVFAFRQKIKGEFHLALYASFALAWSLGSLYFCLLVLQANYPNLLIATEDPSNGIADRLGALLALFGLFGSSAYFLFDVVATFARNLYFPVSNSVEGARAKILTRRAGDMDRSVVKALLRRNPLFEPMTESSVDYLVANGWLRDYPTGTRLILQGTTNHALFAILSGKVSVTRREPTGAKVQVATLGAGSAFGEISAIYDRLSTADVVATEPVRALVMHKNLLRAFGETGDGKVDYERMIGRVMLSHFLSSSPLFTGLPQELIHVFSNEGQIVNVPEGTMVTEQGSLDKTFYLVVHGKVDVLVNESPVKTLGQGEFFGEISLIADVPRTASVRSAVECVLLKIDSQVFWKVLAANIRLSLFIERVAELRSKETRMIEEEVAS